MKEIESITFHFTIKKEGNLTEVCQFSYQRKTEENFDRNVIDRIFITSFSRFLSRPNEKWKSWNFIPSPREFRPISLATNCLQILSIYPYDLRSRKRDRREFRNLLRTTGPYECELWMQDSQLFPIKISSPYFSFYISISLIFRYIILLEFLESFSQKNCVIFDIISRVFIIFISYTHPIRWK